MNIQWVLADQILLDPTVDLSALKESGPLWGSWTTWRSCNTDNVICHDVDKAQDLIKNKFNTACNLFVHQSVYDTLKDPKNIRAYGGEFSHEIEHPDEVISLFLTASADVVLLLGFDWSQSSWENHSEAYRGIIKHLISTKSETQWVIVDSSELTPELSDLENVTVDTLKNVLSIL